MARMSASCVATACCSVPMSVSQKQTEPVESPVVTVAAWVPLGKRQKRRCRGLCHQSTPTAQSRHYKCADIPQERRRPHQRRCLGRRRHRHAADDATCISTKDNADHRWCDEHNFYAHAVGASRTFGHEPVEAFQSRTKPSELPVTSSLSVSFQAMDRMRPTKYTGIRIERGVRSTRPRDGSRCFAGPHLSAAQRTACTRGRRR